MWNKCKKKRNRISRKPGTGTACGISISDLKLCFGEKYGVTYKESEKGTCVEVKIPAMTMEEAEEKI